MEGERFERTEKSSCPVRTTLNMIGGKWAFSIIYALLHGTKRFKELKSLEEWGIVKRQAYATVPPTVEYSLTDKGVELQPVLAEIQNWAVKHI
jgi:DNA-binding HxlR family transcriptional regulator